jgi:S1-C subfamily serine protease
MNAPNAIVCRSNASRPSLGRQIVDHATSSSNSDRAAKRPRRIRLATGAFIAVAAILLAACGGGSSGSHQAANAQASNVQTQFVKTVKTVLPSVVEVRTPDGLGSGVVIDTNGNIVTNAHVVGSSQSLQVRASTGKNYAATLVGSSSENDLAVIHAEGANLSAATLGDSSKLRVGNLVLAIGNPLGLASSVTNGIVSAVGRTVDESSAVALRGVIQTSAPINPGNSGGALVDVNGRVVGVPTLTAVDAQDNQLADGIGFAIPSNSVKRIAGQLLAGGG